jgi:membrane protein implicated in regulation of membrane protease activity
MAGPVHFILFCDVVGLRRNYELLWAGVYVLNAGVCLGLNLYPWWVALLVQTPLTIFLIALEMRRRRQATS